MTDLSQTRCEACHAGARLATAEETAQFMRQLTGWQVVSVDGVNQLRRSFKFRNFKQAIAFTNEVGKIAEAEGHHPAILTEWGRVTVSWWTHKIGGLHRNDFIMAAKTDRLL
ncbi:4a-hydroxytetrahydrobiopterin dehydratase [Geothermobacter hydrogeniphilus]|uniref:Putative pterin-4-alpha-carbinolamine dehydratase n=1 Tax=Geothermobacter hydrogeniphilus TaxID=1969733 RepID=A0A2K2H9I0_9BACT|nr:4a-hydroxytetrahydrobiopterin dehydratase [Geothermobacter hydrogeniphilus]PNU19927.1 4a-hydroxytetrahydrobiopterin dehydratase [Geothermobacter hydrogeniphilus]